MFSTNRILLFVASVILFGLLVGLELGLILIITALVCFNSYEPFSNSSSRPTDLHYQYDDELLEELDECQSSPEESESSQQLKAEESKDKVPVQKDKKKMSLWRPRKSAAASAKISTSNTQSPKKFPSLSSPSPRPPLHYTSSPLGKSSLRPDNTTNEDQENTGSFSLWGNPYSPSRRKPLEHSKQSSSGTSSGPLLSSPFLPRVKRAIGLGEAAAFRKQSNSPRRSSYGVSSGNVFSPQPKALPYPSASSPGLMPLVRLGRHEKPTLTENNSNMVHSPVTVKIAAPSPRRLAQPRMLLSKDESQPITRRAPDKDTVLSALREKSRKRGIASQDESVCETTDQQAKRRKQDDSTSSSSSMASEPEFLAELPVNGYSDIPLHMVGVKRPATPTVDLEHSPSMDRITKKAKNDPRNNSIASSLSSSRRGMAKEMSEFHRGEKRKPEESCRITDKEPSSKQTKRDVLLPVCSASSIPVPEMRTRPRTPAAVSLTDTPTQTVAPPAPEEANPPVSLKKKLLLDAERASQKIKKGIYIGLTSPKSKMTSLDVTTNPDDYDKDPEAERQRAIDLLTNNDADDVKLKKDNIKTDNTSSVENTQSSLSTTFANQKPAQGEGTAVSLSSLLNKETEGEKTNTAQNTGGILSSIVFATTTTASATSVEAPAPLTASGTASTTTTLPTSTTGVDKAPQFTFKPVFPTPTPASSTSTSNPAPTTGGFTFNTITTTTTTAAPASSQISATVTSQATPASAAPTSTVSTGFSFGALTQSSTNSAAGTGTGTSQQSQPINFSASTGSQSGSVVNPQTSTSAPVFGFGATTPQVAATVNTNTTTAPSSGFSFGVASTASKPATATSSFSFGQGASSAATPISQAPTAGFGAMQSSALPAPAANTSLFSFGASQQATTTTAATSSSSFGTTGFGVITPASAGVNQKSTASVFGIPAQAPATTSSQPSGLVFGQTQPATTITAASTAAPSSTGTGVFSFGAAPAPASNQNTKPQTGLFNFGAAASTNPTTTTGFAFGSNKTPAQPNSSVGFGFNRSSTAPSAFTQPTSTPFAQSSTTGSLFGTATTTTQSSTSGSVFGSQPATTAPPAFGSTVGSFSFGQTSTPAFGQTTTASSSTGFGTTSAPSKTTAPSSSAFQFGSTNSTAPSAFGSSGSTFAFGAASNTTPNTGSAFGTKPTPLPVPTFGAPQTTQANTFGQSAGSAFGAFGSQQSSNSVFGAAPSQPGTGPAPAFGQSTAPAFGSSNPASQGSFAFGQSTNPTTVTPAKGFDFSAAASGTPSLQFGSAAPVGASTPAFGGGGFGTSTGGGGGGMFSVGSGSTAPRPRSRIRRKGAKR